KAARGVAEYLARVPWVQFIGVTGSVAACNALKKDDIDLIIICKKNRAWISRFFIVLILKALGVYPTGENREGKICPNIIIDTNSMAWDKDRQNLYVAHEIFRILPVFDRGDAEPGQTYFDFFRENDWIWDFLDGKAVNKE